MKTHIKKFHNPATKDDMAKIYKHECPKCFALFKVIHLCYGTVTVERISNYKLVNTEHKSIESV